MSFFLFVVVVVAVTQNAVNREQNPFFHQLKAVRKASDMDHTVIVWTPITHEGKSRREQCYPAGTINRMLSPPASVSRISLKRTEFQ